MWTTPQHPSNWALFSSPHRRVSNDTLASKPVNRRGYRCPLDSASQPLSLAFKFPIARIGGQKRFERRYESTDGPPPPWKPFRRHKHDPRMPSTADNRGPMELDEVRHVPSHYRASVLSGPAQELRVGPIRTGHEISRGRHVMTPPPQLPRDFGREVLVQDELHPRMARSRRAAASSRSAAAVWRCSQSSISSGNAA